MLLTEFNVGNGPAEDVEAEHDLEFQFALFQDDQSDLDNLFFLHGFGFLSR